MVDPVSSSRSILLTSPLMFSVFTISITGLKYAAANWLCEFFWGIWSERIHPLFLCLGNLPSHTTIRTASCSWRGCLWFFTYIHVLPDVVLLPEECAGYCYFLPDVSNIPIILGDIGAYVNEAVLFFCFTISDCRPRLASLLRFTFITLHFVAFSFSTFA